MKYLKDLFLKTYWLNKRINDGKKLYFNKIFMPKFINSINKNFSISKYSDLKYAFSQAPVKGLFNTIFNPNENFFNSLDLAVAINISVNGYCNPNYVNNKVIADSSNFICKEFKERIYHDKILKEHLKEMDRKISDFQFRVDWQAIQNILTDKVKIFKTYYSRFEQSEYKKSITIYHQSESNSWVDWKDENTITINHNLIKFNNGFFLCGFDYKLYTGEHLRIATEIHGNEYFNPKEYDDWSNGVIWAA